MLEIERKFIMTGFPEELLSAEEYKSLGLWQLREVDIEQGYISIEPEVRLHGARDTLTQEENFRLTLKGDGDLARTELITDVSHEFFRDAKQMLHGEMIKKLYRKYQYGELLLEVCQVDAGTEHEFYYGEIEFNSEEEAKAFVAPAWLGEEVTYDDKYKMKNYWKRTRL
ncbi:MAG: adenylate cyclase [Agathobacter sp.]|nr:adenylate cyclase [Agathobacter sp.]